MWKSGSLKGSKEAGLGNEEVGQEMAGTVE